MSCVLGRTRVLPPGAGFLPARHRARLFSAVTEEGWAHLDESLILPAGRVASSFISMGISSPPNRCGSVVSRGTLLNGQRRAGQGGIFKGAPRSLSFTPP